jgi:hypothetical protein
VFGVTAGAWAIVQIPNNCCPEMGSWGMAISSTYLTNVAFSNI